MNMEMPSEQHHLPKQEQKPPERLTLRKLNEERPLPELAFEQLTEEQRQDLDDALAEAGTHFEDPAMEFLTEEELEDMLSYVDALPLSPERAELLPKIKSAVARATRQYFDEQ